MSTTYETRHGSPYDRGSADAWYGRPFDPHYYKGASFASERVERAAMTPEEIEAYTAGYRGQGGRKDYGQWDEPTRDAEAFDDYDRGEA